MDGYTADLLDHAHPDCTGRWRREGALWRCDRCSAGHPAGPGVAAAAIRENVLGILLRHLAFQGASDSGKEW